MTIRREVDLLGAGGVGHVGHEIGASGDCDPGHPADGAPTAARRRSRRQGAGAPRSGPQGRRSVGFRRKRLDVGGLHRRQGEGRRRTCNPQHPEQGARLGASRLIGAGGLFPQQAQEEWRPFLTVRILGLERAQHVRRQRSQRIEEGVAEHDGAAFRIVLVVQRRHHAFAARQRGAQQEGALAVVQRIAGFQRQQPIAEEGGRGKSAGPPPVVQGAIERPRHGGRFGCSWP